MKKIISNLFAIVIGIVISLIILEIFLNIYNPFEFRQKGDKIVLPANYKLIFENDKTAGLDTLITHTKNSIGFRGPELPEDINSMNSLITVGGSTTECFYISDGKDWPALLSKKLNNKFSNFWVNNAGLDGHSTFGHQILLNDFLIDINPDFILYFIGCNDVGRTDLNKFDKARLKDPGNWKYFLQSAGNLKDYLKNNSELISLIVNLNRNFQARKMKITHNAPVFSELDFLDEVPLQKLNQIKKKNEKPLKLFRSRIKNLVNTSKQNNIIPVLITQPSLLGIGFDDVTGLDLETVKYPTDDGGKVYWEELELYNNVTRKVAAEENVLLIDLAVLLPKSTKYLYDTVHFTNEGAEKVAQIVFNELKEAIKDFVEQQEI